MLGVDAKESFEPVFTETDRSLPGLLIGVQLCVRSRDFEPLKRDVSVIITHAPFTTLVEQPWCFFSFFFFFWLRTFHPLNSSFMIRPHVVMFSERFWWWTQFKRQMLLKNAFYSPEIVSGSLAFNCHPVSINHVIIYLITNS